MIKFLLGISITINVIAIIGFLIIYKYSLKGLKHKIEEYTLENFMDLDLTKLDIGSDEDDY